MRRLLLTPILVLGLWACAVTPTRAPGDAPAAVSSQTVAAATSNITAASGSLVSGKLRLAPSPNGVRITGEIGGLAPGSLHGFHVHEAGDCSAADASSAGGHFNPGATAHGSPQGRIRHAGDIGNLLADADGVARVNARITGVSLGNGADGILGRALIVDAAPDDYRTQPSGNAGARIACGMIRPGR